MTNKINFAVVVGVVIVTVSFLGGCGATESTTEIQKQQGTTETAVDVQAVDEIEQGEMAKICSDYCEEASQAPEISKKVCNGFCGDVVKQCEENEAAQMLSAESCIKFGMLEPLSKKYPSVKAQIDAMDAKAQGK
ncbi:MAG: hypothetical protein U9Q12_00170 [Patescibacteria group bacterium]|nr:hypothetical protein [Patescibacteria group bacterium]